MTKHNIKPHKGGRVVQFKVRVTPELKEIIDKLAAQRGISQGDLIEQLVTEAHAESAAKK